MKKIILISASVFATLLFILLFFSGKYNYPEPMCFVWADKTINVYDRKSNSKKTYEFEEYNCRDIGKYYGGDFCCIGDKDGAPYALLFKDGIIENYAILPYNTEKIAVWQDDIIAFSNGKIYKINIQSQECNPLIDNVANRLFYINENGDIAFLREGYEENNADEVFALYVYSNDEEAYIGNISRILYWQSNEEIVVRTSYSSHPYEEDGHMVYPAGESNDYIINVKTKVWEKTKLFKKAAGIVSWKQGSTAIGWSYISGYANQYAGTVNIQAKRSFTPNFTAEAQDLISDIGFFEWYEENPMENTADGSTS